jgi:DNA-binding transcriptional ArsR family regulator
MGRGLDGYFSSSVPEVAVCAVFRWLPVRAVSRTFAVAIARGKHLFPFRTEQLSLSAPMVLGPQGPGRVGRRRFNVESPPLAGSLRLWRGHLRAPPPDSSRLDVCRYRNMIAAMARAATTTDVFNAIGEQQRREILVLLRAGEGPVTELAQELGMTLPGASKHLRVLREVGLVRDRKAGKQRLYGLDARGLRPVHEWTGGFERFWNESFDRLDEYVQDLKQARQEE